jgi:hypothetical protein
MTPRWHGDTLEFLIRVLRRGVIGLVGRGSWISVIGLDPLSGPRLRRCQVA